MSRGLTRRETDVLNTILSGRTSQSEVARALVIDVRTVQTYMQRLFEKTGAQDKTQLVLWAWRNGWTLGANQ